MRVVLLLLAVIIGGCASDLVDPGPGPGPVASALSLLPASATLDTAATVAFLPSLAWSDSADHPAALVYTATGGTISAVGVYQAGSIAGQYQAIVTCDCGLADTADITIAVNAPPLPLSAQLTVIIAGLPSLFIPQVNVSGPDGFTRSISATTVIDPLIAGTYEVRANGVTVGSNSYGPDTASRTIMLGAGATDTVTVTYRQLPSNGLPPHPRVWMTAERLARLQVQRTNNTSRWQNVLLSADRQVAKNANYSAGDEYSLPDLGLAYLATGAARYATRAGLVLAAYATPANLTALRGDDAYHYRYALPMVVAGFDWSYDGLSTAQRQQVATWLMDAADWVWPETNAVRASGWAVNSPGNNYWWGFMATGPAALAAAGDDTGRGAISGADRPGYHMALARAKWDAVGRPYLESTGAGGGWTEGTGYDSSWPVAKLADAFLTAGRPLSTTSWFSESLRYRLHVGMPGFKTEAPFSDQARVSYPTYFAYDRLKALELLDVSGADATLKGQVKFWLDQISAVPTAEDNYTSRLAREALFYDPGAGAAPDLSGLPLYYHAKGAGYVLARTSWTDPSAMALAFDCGPELGDHRQRSGNALLIWGGGDWISGNANIYSHSGIEAATANHNTMTAGPDWSGNRGQTGSPSPGNGDPNRCAIRAAPTASGGLLYWRGQASEAYGSNGVPFWPSRNRNVPNFLRTVAFLPEITTVIVVDEVTVLDGTQPKVFRWHSKDSPQVNGNTFRLQNPSGSSRCFGNVLSPSDVVLGAESFALGSLPGVSSNAVTVSMSGRNSDVAVTVLQCTSAQSPPLVPTATVSATEVAVTLGGQRVVVPLNESRAVRIE